MDWISATAVSFTVSGNTGIAPFMSLFLVGLIEKTNPDLLYMDGFIEQILSSWAALVILGILCVLEFVGKCVPVIDEIIDSALTVVVPFFSILGSLSTFGLFTMPSTEITMGGEDGDYVGDVYDYDEGGDDVDGDGDGRRQLASSAASGVLIFFQVMVVFIGILLALCLHGLKMIVRLMGEGCLTNCITVLEYMWIGISITLAIFIRQVAICIAILFCLVAAYITKRRFVDKKTIEDIAKTDGDAVRSAVAAQTSAVVVTVNPQSIQLQTPQSGTTTSQQDFVKMENDEEHQQQQQQQKQGVSSSTASSSAVPVPPVSYQSSF